MPLPDKYIRDPINETNPGEQVCEGWVGDEKTGQAIHCPRKPDWVVHSRFREVGKDKVCDENFYCDKHFFEKFRPTTNETEGITFIEFGFWFRGDKSKKTKGIPVAEKPTKRGVVVA